MRLRLPAGGRPIPLSCWPPGPQGASSCDVTLLLLLLLLGRCGPPAPPTRPPPARRTLMTSTAVDSSCKMRASSRILAWVFSSSTIDTKTVGG